MGAIPIGGPRPALAASDFDAPLPPRQVLRSEWVVDRSTKNAGIDRGQCGSQLSSSSGSQIPGHYFEQCADMPCRDVRVPVMPLFSATGSASPQNPAPERERDIAL
jgi:hypothetical protein